ncbi:MAG: hypothetical protein MUP60_04905 [Candidatus Thorarchaeota archaeon]|nr:hypothetical protein [Candidatus Thorarchaeota archaeon]
MDKKREFMYVLTFFIVVSFIIIPVLAGRTTYNDDTPSEIFGSWNYADNCDEETVSGSYRCVMEFVYYGIRTDGYSYYINIDYDGVHPGYLWNYESLLGRYKWGSGAWEDIAVFDYIPGDYDWPIDGPTGSNTLYLQFLDLTVTSDSIYHTWYFSDTPFVAVDY